MSSPMIRAFIQARMSSTRFPGKVLAPFHGQPLVWHVLGAVTRSLPGMPIVVATSDNASDDPLAAYLKTIGAVAFRGPLEDVFERFRLCVSHYPCDWILRLSADSPLLDGRVLQAVVEHAEDPAVDVVTTIFPRTFPNGQNAELIRASTFLSVEVGALSADDREHVTPFFYRNVERFRIVNVESGNARLAAVSLAVETVDDLHRLERLSDAEIQQCSHSALTLSRS